MAEQESRSRRALGAIVTAVLVLVAAAVAVLLLTRDDWERSGPPLAVDGWAPYWQTLDAYDSFDANADVFRDVSVVAYSALAADQVVPYERLSVDAVPRFAERASPAGVAVLATIFDDSPAGTMAAVLADETSRAQHVTTIASIVRDGGFAGVDLDYEQFAFSDGQETWDATRPNWISFLRELADVLHADGKLLVVSVPSPSYTVYDHAAMGGIVDRIRIMAYDYSTSEPGPIAPVEWVREVVDALTENVPPEKLDLGIPLYGYDWPVATSGTCTGEQPSRRVLSMAGALALAAERSVVPVFDEETEEARFDYSETLPGCTVERTVRFLDDRAIHRRAWIAHREDLHGVALWALGDESPSAWPALRLARAGTEDWPTE